MRRHFADIGGTRIRNAILAPYYDELLQEAVGQEVGLSITGPAPEQWRGDRRWSRSVRRRRAREADRKAALLQIDPRVPVLDRSGGHRADSGAIPLVGAWTSVTVFWIGLRSRSRSAFWMILPSTWP